MSLAVSVVVVTPPLILLLLEKIGIAAREVRAALVVNFVVVWIAHRP
jgi:hypothetical protein